MSLLEDVFLQDEAGEAQELERIIEGDDYDEEPRDRADSNENSEKEDEAEEDKRRVDPASTKTKKVVKNPRFILNPARLTGPRGIQVIPEHFKDFKFKGKGHEKEDLDLVLKKLEHWAYRLYPKFDFEDCLKKIETLGKKRPVMVHLHKIRSDQLVTEEAVVQQDSSDDEAPPVEQDEFDKLLAEQIELARSTPGPGSVKKPGFGLPFGDKISPITMPKATSSPSISDEQKERMLRNRKLAEERRLARLKTQPQNGNTVDLTSSENDNKSDEKESVANNDNPVIVNDDKEEEVRTRKNRSHIIDSSDSESDMVINEDMMETDDIHKSNKVIDITNGYESNNKISDNTDTVPAVVEAVSVNAQNEVIDITNRYHSKERVIQENIVDSEVIDITQVQNNKTTIQTNEIIDLNELEGITLQSKRSRMSNIIDSSDSDDDFAVTAVNESITVDVHKKSSQKQTENKTETEVIDITQVQNTLKTMQTNETIDLNELESVTLQNKRSRMSNIIDTSDSDDDFAVTTVNESITVDIHNIASQTQTENKIYTEKESENPGDNNKIDSHFNDDDILASIGEDQVLNGELESAMKPNVSDDTANKIEDSKTTEPQPNLDLDMNKRDNETINENGIITEETNKNIINAQKENQLDEEFMDIDFSDDF